MDIKIEAGQSHPEIVLRVGETLTLRLDEQPTTGFRWAASLGNVSVLETLASTFALPADGGVGGGGERSLNFRAKAAGKCPVHLTLKQQWSDDVPEKQVHLSVVVSV
jgi:inhibitor of cysteine peptidase